MENELKNNFHSVEASDLVNEEIDEDSLFKRVNLDETESEHIAAEPYSYWKAVFRVFIKKPAAIISLTSLAILLLGMIIIPLFAPEGSMEVTANSSKFANLAPSLEHLFGTDQAGRDLFFMCWKGLGLSLLLGIVESAIVVLIGTLIGLAWGYFRWLDRIMIEIYNLISNVPSLLLYMLLASILKEAFPRMATEVKMIISLTITSWIGIALFIRNQTIIITNREYNIASVTLGTPPMRIMTRNLLPYLLAVIITQMSMLIPGMISSEVSMSYFGVGLSSDTIAIGVLLNEGRALFTQYPWQLLAPAGMLAVIILTFFLMGLALSDALDPKKHR